MASVLESTSFLWSWARACTVGVFTRRHNRHSTNFNTKKYNYLLSCGWFLYITHSYWCLVLWRSKKNQIVSYFYLSLFKTVFRLGRYFYPFSKYKTSSAKLWLRTSFQKKRFGINRKSDNRLAYLLWSQRWRWSGNSLLVVTWSLCTGIRSYTQPPSTVVETPFPWLQRV